jgi:serine/threonine protein kinase
VVKIGDFGLARDLKDEASKLLSRRGAGAANHKSRFAENRHLHTEGVGTGVYASPEQVIVFCFESFVLNVTGVYAVS